MGKTTDILARVLRDFLRYGALLALFIGPTVRAQTPAATAKTADSTLKTPAPDNGKFGARYSNLSDDNPLYTPKLPIWRPMLDIVAQEIILNQVDHYLLDLEYSHVGFNSFAKNLKAGGPWSDGWKWDQDRMGLNFFFHPYTGVQYFDAARAAGYDFWECIPYTIGGSYAWKMFGETGTPEREDLINTTLGGMFGGEILYRISSNVLNDQKSGLDRFLRELIAGILSPARFMTRLFAGDLWRTTTEEVYQKEPLNIAMYAGAHMVNDNKAFGTGLTTAVYNLQLDYGDPFEHKDRKPYDFFKVRTDFNFGSGRKIIDNVMGYGLLFGKNLEEGKLSLLIGGFQEYDFWDNTTFELATLGFGAGVISNMPVFEKANLYTTLHVSLVPFGGNNFRHTPDTSQVRDYSFGGGFQGKLETTISLGASVSASMMAYYYFFHDYNINDYPGNERGNSLITILRPRITVGLFDDMSLGFEHMIYYNDRYTIGLPDFHNVRTEQRLFLQLFIQNRKLDKIITDVAK